MSDDDSDPGKYGKSGKKDGSAGRTADQVAAFKRTHNLKILVFLWLCTLHVLGFYFFTKGFLLTRLILNDKSTCEGSPVQDIKPHYPQDGCWYPKKFDRAVIVVIDALRYDFVVPFVPDGNDVGAKPKSFHNAFPILYEMAKASPEKAFLLPFIADPPTTTLQRLKGLTTGSLPTFMDAGSNFAGTAIEEDNLLAQMRSLNKTLVHLGDDTWQALFPGHFDMNLSRPFDSFNVWDLHTVDDGVFRHIMPLLHSEERSWDVMFAHFLGVDHAGHRYGPDHPATREKLQQMNGVVDDMVKSLDDETLLVIMGDHGMDTKGDHGGESDDEVEAALWMYSKQPAFGRIDSSHIDPPANAKIRPVRQTDLVSTLSLLLGLPIPFNNIGSPIGEAFAEAAPRDWTSLASVNLIAAAQIHQYQEEYARARDLSVDTLHSELYGKGQALIARRPKNPRPAYLALREYEAAVLVAYRQLWANFDVADMIMGVGVLIVALFFAWVIYQSSESSSLGINVSAFAAHVGGTVVAAGVKLIVPGFLGLALAISCLLMVSSLTFYFSRLFVAVSILPQSVWSWIAFAFTLSQAAGFASNSYTIHEDTILLFFLTTFGACGIISSLRQSDPADQYGGVVQSVSFALLTRVASFSRLCREEQMPGCRSTFYASSTSSVSAPWQILLPFAIALLLPLFIKARFKGTASYVGPAGFWIGFCFRVGLFLVAVYWTLDAADNGRWLQQIVDDELLKKATLTLSRCVIGIAIVVGSVVNFQTRPCLDVEAIPPDPNDSNSSDSKPVIAILGYANLHGTRYFLLLPALHLLTTILLPPMGQFSLSTCLAQILSLVELLDHNNLSTTSTIGPIILACLGSFHFFKTGHQATLASIQWNAAFVPLRTIIYPWSPLLIMLNTFGAQILCAVAVPLIVLWKRPVDRTAGADARLQRHVWRAMVVHVGYFAVVQLATTLWAGHLRRHLMLYRVFMPRFLMASVAAVVVDLVLVLVAWPMVRVNTLSVGELVGG